MQFNLNLKSVKQSAANLSLFFKNSGYSIPKSVILDGMAKVFFFKNWNTLEGKLSDPFECDLKREKKMIVIININKDKEYLLSKIKDSAIKAKFKYEISDFKEKNNTYQIEFEMMNTGANNFITFWMCFGKEIKKDNAIVKDCYFWRITKEIESLNALFN